LTLPADPANPLEASTKQYVDAKPAGIAEAPTDGNAYARANSAWSDVRPIIWYARQRGLNVLHNPGFEIDQANAHAKVPNAPDKTRIADRWFLRKTGTMTVDVQSYNGAVTLPNTSRLTNYQLQVTLTGAEATLAAGDLLAVEQVIEGPNYVRLLDDVSSVSLMASCTVAPITFSVAINEGGVYVLTKNFTISTANTLTVFTLPNIPKFYGYGDVRINWEGYRVAVGLAAGANAVATADGVWTGASGTFRYQSPGATNFASLATGTVFSLGFIQHEPGAYTGGWIAPTYADNLHSCERYYWTNTGHRCVFHCISVNTADGWCPFGQHIAFPGSGGSQVIFTPYSPITNNPNQIYDHSDGSQPTGITVNGAGDSGIFGLSASGNNLSGNMHLILVYFVADTQW
jgi:hypothetical protein